MIQNTCDGCKGLCKTTEVTIINDGEEMYCPCQTCLIKTMCKDGCDAFSEYIEMQDLDY